jgi:DNA-binding CsgD family transcriptional regulator
MGEAEHLSAVIGDIYDASLDPSLWPSAFDNACKFVGGVVAVLHSQDNFHKIANIYFASAHDPQYRTAYVDKYFKINPIFPTVVFHEIETPLNVTDLVPREELCRTQFAKEWLAPQGYVDGVFAPVEKSTTGCALFTVMRHFSQGFVDDEMRRRFALVVPHVRRSSLIGNVIELHKVAAAALADSLDTLSAGMFIVEATGRIVHANASGHAMVADGDVLRAQAGRLAACDLHASQALADAFVASEAGDAALGRGGIAVPLQSRSGERFVAHMLPLKSGARRAGGVHYAAAAVVFVRKAALNLPSPPEAIARQFKLTPAEIRVLFAIVEVGGVAEVAQIIGISEPTIKTHIQHLFHKTGSSRQADLVKLVAGYSNPLVD